MGESASERKVYADWVRRGLDKPGKTQDGLADVLGVDRSAISKMIGLKRRIKADEVPRIAAYIEEPPPGRVIPVSGRVGAGQEICPVDDDAPIAWIEAPPGIVGNVAAVEVGGDSMYHVFQDKDVILYGEPERPSPRRIGRRVVVRTSDGRMFAKILRRGTRDGLYNLESLNAPLIEDVAVEWVAPILWIKPYDSPEDDVLAAKAAE